MAISTYAELQTAIQNWMDDTSLSSRVPEFITLAESRINADLGNIRMAWRDSSLTGTPSSRNLALPSGFIEARALFLTTYGDQQRLAPFVMGERELSTTDGIPSAWAIDGSNIALDCPCDQAHTFTFRNRAKWDIATDSTNWLLTNHPDVYLAASLVEAWDYREDPNLIGRWEVRYAQAKQRVMDNEGRSPSVARLAVDPALLGKGGATFNYDIGQ